MQTDRMNWNDLRYFLELSRNGRLLSAASRLGVNHTTVSRRIAALEDALGVKLFEQDESGFHLTTAGERLQPLAQQIEDTTDLAKERAQSQKRSFTGSFRIGTPDGFGTSFLAHHVHEFMNAHPNIIIELVPIPLTHNISKREVDLVVSLEPVKKADLFCKKITDYSLFLYVSKKFAKAKKIDASISDISQALDYPFADYISDILYTRELSFNQDIHSEITSRFQSSTVLAQLEFIASGGGIGVLPHYMAASDRRLMALLTDSVSFVRSYWLVIPYELRRLARIRALEKFVLQLVAEHQSLFLADAP